MDIIDTTSEILVIYLIFKLNIWFLLRTNQQKYKNISFLCFIQCRNQPTIDAGVLSRRSALSRTRNGSTGKVENDNFYL